VLAVSNILVVMAQIRSVPMPAAVVDPLLDHLEMAIAPLDQRAEAP
jgi:hypothetical protein